MNLLNRTELLLGEENVDKLKKCNFLVVGLGGVGGAALESLVRSGIQNFTIVDHDIFEESNLNRQIASNVGNIGHEKVLVYKNRAKSINPQVNIKTFDIFLTKESILNILTDDFDYVIDAIDTITSKLDLIENSIKKDIPIISCMGTANKLDPTKLQVADIFSTSVCPMCRVMRKELKKREINTVKVVYSKEEPIKAYNLPEDDEYKKIPGSMMFVPAAAGLIMASYVVMDVLKWKNTSP